MFLYARQQRLEKIIAEQFHEQEKNSKLMISILSHIVEFRNGESGLHILHVNTITKYLLKQLVQLTDQYSLSKADISLISTASALHDIDVYKRQHNIQKNQEGISWIISTYLSLLKTGSPLLP